jgi:protein-tyrosine-phosphatase/DNA-binding transcriptional ArsR family regulator
VAAHPLRWRLLTALGDSDWRVRDLVGLLDEPQSLLSYHLRQLRDGGLVTARRSSHDARDSYYHLDLDRCAEALAATAAALHPALDPAHRDGSHDPPTGRSRRAARVGAVLFVCTGNSARSPIAESLLRHHGGTSVHVASAGTRPKPGLHPNTVLVLREQFGIDVAAQRPRHLETLVGRRFDRVVTLCDKAREACPELPHHPRRTHWSIPDPVTPGASDQATYPAFQQIATDIDTRVRQLLPALGSTDHQRRFHP